MNLRNPLKRPDFFFFNKQEQFYPKMSPGYVQNEKSVFVHP